MTANTLSQIIGVLIIAYLAGLLIIGMRLQKHHAEVWRSLGSFSFSNWSILSSLKILSFALFSGEHRRLNDRTLTLEVYALRLIVLVIIGSIGLWKFGLQTGSI